MKTQNAILTTVISLFLVSTGLLWWFADGGEFSPEELPSEYILDDNGCFDFEQYDDLDDQCYISCDSDEQCEEINELYDQIYEDTYEGSSWLEAFAEGFLDGASSREYSEAETIASYRVEVGQLVNDSGEEIPLGHQLLWSTFSDLFSEAPDFYRVLQVTIFSDGTDKTLAYVEDLGISLFTWELAIDATDYLDGTTIKSKKELQATLIHEYMHILSLNSSQLDFSTDKEECTTYNPDDACLQSDAYLNDFFNEFWRGSFYTEYQSAVEGCDLEGGEECEGLADFYFDNSSSFVSYYAVTDPAEDIAESFAAFVLLPDLDSLSGDAKKKVKFFEDFDELVTLRRDIRKALIKSD